MTLIGLLGWLAAAAAAFELRRRAGLIRDAGHELRGPLGAIALGLEPLRRQPASSRRAAALLVELGRAEAAADDVAAAARGRRAPRRSEPVPVNWLARSSRDAWVSAADRLGRRLSFEWAGDASRVWADPRRLAQAFGNLIANALEHGGGEVVVRGTSAPSGVRVEITDSGGSGSERPRPRGRGRGLVIAERALAEAGGSLDAHDHPGGGRTAVVELPVAGRR